MAGITSSAFRNICLDYKAGLVFSEMISDKGIMYDNKNTTDLLYLEEHEHPIAIQIFGSSVDTLVNAAIYVEKNTKCDILDINMGCPVPKVCIRSKAGSALMKNPQLIYDIVSNVVKSVSIPVMVKIRSGWDENSINAVEVAKLIEQAGASAITIHARTRSQGYSGKANWDIIKQVKESVSIPVIGNGDVIDEISAYNMLEYTKCDAVMIGRKALGNPFIFRRINQYLNNQNVTNTTTSEIKEVFIKHLNGLIKQYGEKTAVSIFRGIGPTYFKGFKDSSIIRSNLSQAKSYKEIIDIITLINN